MDSYEETAVKEVSTVTESTEEEEDIIEETMIGNSDIGVDTASVANDEQTLIKELNKVDRIDNTITEAAESTADDTVETVDTDETVEKSRKRKPRKLPVEPLRRSERTRKMPEKYDQYVMYGMENRPYDARIQALQAVMSSGVLNKMDIELARKVINAIMK